MSGIGTGTVECAGTVEEIALGRWGVRPAPAHERFTESGWSYEEPVARPCPRCAAALHSVRKPYVRGGRTQRYVALVCPACPATFTLADLGLKTYGQVRQTASPPAVAPQRLRPPTVDQEPAAAGTARPVGGAAGRRQRILRFWRSVELFGAQRLDPPNPAQHRFVATPGAPLPWQDAHPLHRERLRDDLVWRHTVYGGVFGIDRLHATLVEAFGSDPAPGAAERVPGGDSAVFAVAVTGDGRVLLDSLVVSTAAWAAGRARRPGPAEPGWLDGFDAGAARAGIAVRELVAAADDDTVAAALADEGVAVSRPVTYESLRALVSVLVRQLGVADVLAPDGIRVHSEVVGRRRAFEAPADFLNSFHLDDLNRVATAVGDGDCGPALAAYLTPDEALAGGPRLDVRDPGLRELLLEQLAPVRVPAGRWPAAVAHPLATSQQLAINTVLDRLGEGAGLFAVNGPPGTGKTTLLRDLIAALVVARARRLARLVNPDAAFGPETTAWRTDRYQRRIRRPRPEFTGFEIVVASSNNGAVANVTREIPLRSAVAGEWESTARYFADHATRVLGEPAWGLVAAVLGNRANRTEFVSRFWYGQPADPAASAEQGFQAWLGACDPPATDWAAAVSAFRAAVAAEQRLRDARQDAHEALRGLPELVAAERAATAAVRVATAEHRGAGTAAEEAERVAVAARAVADDAHGQRQRHEDQRPAWWRSAVTLGRAGRRWRALGEPLIVACAAADEAATGATVAAGAARHRAVLAAGALTTATAAHDEVVRAVTTAREVLAAARRECGPSVPDDAWCADEARRESAAPWLDERWNAARTRVFLAALDLHAAFVAGAARVLRANLRAAVDVLAGQAPVDAPEVALRAVWQSLFLVVPVVSTTFASVGRLLGQLGRDAVGWLLVDEAGQAAPQAAVGAVWRARRVLVVGDPLQLEPVGAAPPAAEEALRRHHDVPEVWTPGGTSVQGLADRVTGIGTWLPGPDDSLVWVGAPLRVHRRCDNPMFDIVNTAVYGGLMLPGTATREELPGVPPSGWFDVPAGVADGHWLPAEGAAVLDLLDELTGCGIDQGRVMAVSPFRDAARHLHRLLAHRYPRVVRGTVHTAQGKEADVVVFVLGGDPARPGARAWAASRPNLFNVAVSRARRRLYVVGDHDGWAKLRYFSTLAQALPVRSGQS